MRACTIPALILAASPALAGGRLWLDDAQLRAR